MKITKSLIILRSRQRFFLLVLIFLTLPIIINSGWQEWLARTPQPLLDKSVIGDSKSYGSLRGNYYEVSIPLTTPTKAGLEAHYRLWIPNDVKSLRGLIVKQHGCGDPAKITGLDHANDLQWQALASKHQFALLGTKLPTVYPMCTDEAGIDRVTEQMFLKALTALAEKSHHPELDKVPWALWGHSGGADWSMQMLHHYPKRVIAVVNTRCGGILFSSGRSEILDLDPKSVSEMLAVPVLWTIGDRDPNVNECINYPKQIFSKFRTAGANWTIATEVNAAHEAGETRFLAIPYLDAVLAARVTDGTTNLQAVREVQGWLGNTDTHEIAPVEQYKGNPLVAAWLPNEETARKWQQYSTMSTWNRSRHGLCRVAEKALVLKVMQYPTESCYSSKILPTRKPAAPTNVHAVRIGEADAVLSWSFSPDLENGLPSFRIYRNELLVSTFKGQGYNFGDAPEKPHVVLEFRDRNVRQNVVYTVSAFNALGESVSKPVALAEGKRTLITSNSQ